MARKPAAYTNESITSLKGADRVRKRPGVIFGSDGVDGCGAEAAREGSSAEPRPNINQSIERLHSRATLTTHPSGILRLRRA